jgi:6-pyruvoyltetrahydropterin/6-carboxytetrahydropterin synthase
MRISKTITFDAAHFLPDCGKERPYARMHGHSFTLEAVVEGDTDPEKGWVVDFGVLAEALEDLKRQLDHRLLNEIEGLKRPTLENVARFAAERLKARVPGLKEVRVSRPSIGESCVYEISRNS